MSAPCPDRELALQAFVDDELDPVSSVEFENHLRNCRNCQLAYERLLNLRALLEPAALKVEMPQSLRDRVAEISAGDAPQSTGMRRAFPWLGGGAIGALAASVALLVTIPAVTERDLADQVADGQIRSLQSGHLIDVESTDRHTVKPWFNGKVDFAPPVVDLAEQGFPLFGGRLDVLDHRTVAVLVYKRGKHSINLYVRPATERGDANVSSREIQGSTVLHWNGSDLEYWAVSDVAAPDLRRFVSEYREQAGH